jgi:oligopeptide transport system ATP-binding protein
MSDTIAAPAPGMGEIDSEVVLTVDNLTVKYPVRGANGRPRGTVHAVTDVSFELLKGETYGIVGESGCGKTTLGKTLLGLVKPVSGTAQFGGHDLFALSPAELRKVHREIQMVFQDPYSSLNPRRRVGSTLTESLKIQGVPGAAARRDLAMRILARMGFSTEHYYRFPHEFSGGQLQRIGIARALIGEPRLVVCDEPVSALDVSIQSQILNLLNDLQEELALSLIFISHDLGVVKHVAHRVGVMYLGEIVEEASSDQLFSNPLHPYTRMLLSAIPVPDPTVRLEHTAVTGEIPSPLNPPSGCKFRTRCPMAMEVCAAEHPAPRLVEMGHKVACHLYTDAEFLPEPSHRP